MDISAFEPYRNKGLLYQDISLVLSAFPSFVSLNASPLSLSVRLNNPKSQLLSISFPLDYPYSKPILSSEIPLNSLNNWCIYKNDTDNSKTPPNENRLLLLILDILNNKNSHIPKLPPKPVNSTKNTISNSSSTPKQTPTPTPLANSEIKSPPSLPPPPIPAPKLSSHIYPYPDISKIPSLSSIHIPVLPKLPNTEILQNSINQSNFLISNLHSIKSNSDSNPLLIPTQNQQLICKINSYSDTLSILDNLYYSKNISLNQYIQKIRSISKNKADCILSIDK